MRYILIMVIAASLYAQVAKVTQHFGVVTTTVKREKVTQSKELYGYVSVDESKIFEVVPRYAGYVEQLYANRLYMKVHKGEALAVVYSPDVFKAKEEYLRSYEYAKKRKAAGMLRSAKLKLQLLGVSEAEIKSVVSKRTSSEHTTVYAPHSGYIFAKEVNEGSAFAKAQRLFEIVDLSQEWIRLKVSDRDVEWVRDVKGFDVSFEGLSGRYRAVFDIVEPRLDPKEALYTVRLLVENGNERIFPGMYAKVRAKKELGEHLVLPASALIRKNGSYYAFLATEFEGEFDVVRVKARRIGERYIVLEGLKEGDRVVRSAMFMMDSDAEINQLY